MADHAEAGSGTTARVGFDLYRELAAYVPSKTTYAEKVRAHLDLYKQCRKAAGGNTHDTTDLK